MLSDMEKFSLWERESQGQTSSGMRTRRAFHDWGAYSVPSCSHPRQTSSPRAAKRFIANHTAIQADKGHLPLVILIGAGLCI